MNGTVRGRQREKEKHDQKRRGTLRKEEHGRGNEQKHQRRKGPRFLIIEAGKQKNRFFVGPFTGSFFSRGENNEQHR